MEVDFKTLDSVHLHIVGLGLMGGSLAMSLRGKVKRLTAEDIDPQVVKTALENEVIDGVHETADADIIVLAVPSDIIIRVIPQLTMKSGVLVLDLGSTKKLICDRLDTLPADVLTVGGHPMCGLAENGFQNAVPDLYHDARFVLCETQRTTKAARKLAEQLVGATGAQPIWMDRERHDYLTGLTSHVPHLLNFGLMRLAMAVLEEDSDLYELAAGGFDGATRLARTDETMIVGMLSTNAEHVRALSARLRTHLHQLEQLLEDPTNLERALSEIVEARRYYSDHYGERPIA